MTSRRRKKTSFLSATKLCSFKGFFKLTYPRFDEEVFDELVTKLDLPRKKPLSQFSKGMKRQAIVAAALACRTKYILLDEAFDGLDPAMRKLIRTMIVDDIFDRGATLVVSSHNITEIGELCDKAMLLHKGEVIFAKDIDDVREGFEKVQIALPELQDLGQSFHSDNKGRQGGYHRQAFCSLPCRSGACPSHT